MYIPYVYFKVYIVCWDCHLRPSFPIFTLPNSCLCFSGQFYFHFYIIYPYIILCINIKSRNHIREEK